MNIVLMRADDNPDPYHDALSSLGEVTSIPVLSFQFTNLEKLKLQLESPQLWSGIIFTSKRAVEATQQCFSNIALLAWSDKPCYVVGEATHKLASEVGFNCIGKECGNSEKLAHYIVADANRDKSLSLLFVCGQMRKDTLPTLLHTSNVQYETVIAYETIANPEIHQNISLFVKKYKAPSHIVYFSPSGYNFCNDLWKNVLCQAYDNVQLVAIGPSTAQEIVCNNNPIIVAQKPNPDSLSKAISYSQSK